MFNGIVGAFGANGCVFDCTCSVSFMQSLLAQLASIIIIQEKSACLILHMQNPDCASQLAVRPDALAWSHIDSCLTSGQHGRRRCSRRLVPEPSQRHQSTQPGSLLIGPGQGQKVRAGPRGLPRPCCGASLVIPVTPPLLSEC